MLLGIPKILSPQLLEVLSSMGHGDEVVIADGNFPAASIAQRLVRADGHGVVPLLEAILQVFPLDRYASPNVMLMEVVKGDSVVPIIWDEYRKLLGGAKGAKAEIGNIERFSFYERAKNAYAVIATGEGALYANIILKKGVVES